ncbi:MAG: PhoH family protein [Micavibrio sp.]|nr:PhoH family protein [Micavibrio sp.]
MAHNLTLEFKDNDLLPLLFGEHNSHLKYLEEKLGITISDRGNQLTLSGSHSHVKTAESILNMLQGRIAKKLEVGKAEIDAVLRFLQDGNENAPSPSASNGDSEGMVIKTRKKTIVPRSPNQALYLQAILDNELVFGLGPAGTGKTYLAVAMAVAMHLEGKVERLIFCRPAVEAGERLGFLPGDLKEKVDPYLRPIYDAIQDMMPWDLALKKMESGEIEIAPLAFMRGRTLSNAFVILDEAQNTTTTQMKMLLTRLGESSRMVVNGDLSQTDLPIGVKSGLRDGVETLEGVEGIHFSKFTRTDVIRHPLVGRIIDAYDAKKGS